MTALELKEYIYKNEKIEYVLQELGCGKIHYNDSKEYWSACFNDGDNNMGCVIKNNKYLSFKSYSRGGDFDENSDIITLVEYIKHISFTDSINYLCKLFNLTYSYSIKDNKPKKMYDPLFLFKKIRDNSKRMVVNVKDIEYLNDIIIEDYTPLLHIKWLKEGIIEKTRKKFGLCYSYKRSRQVIPIRYWKDGSLVGMNQRTMIDNYDELDIKKYLITPSYKKSLNLYGLWENKNYIEKAGYITIVEAEKSVLKRDSLGDSTLVALQGHSISDEQVSIICGLDINEVVISMDKDISEEETWFLCEKFYNIKNVSYMYDKWDLLNDKESTADKSDKIYNFLFKHRFKYDKYCHEKYIKTLKK